MKYLALSLIALALAGCGDTAPAEQVREESAAVEPVPERIAEASPNAPTEGASGSAEVAEGQWFAKSERGSGMAMFGAPYSEAQFSIRCEGDALVFGRSAQLPAGRAEMQLTAGGTTRQLSATAQEDPLPLVTASLPASDAFAGVLAGTTEPIGIVVGEGGEMFRVPSSPAFRQVAADCIAEG